MAETLGNVGSLTEKHKPLKLKGKYSEYWEFHIEPDWLLVCEQNDEVLTHIAVWQSLPLSNPP